LKQGPSRLTAWKGSLVAESNDATVVEINHAIPAAPLAKPFFQRSDHQNRRA
jgi:uncharacterized protein (DUF427 family)